jgi:demethylmenaquinone methyltransferase/2-methoxy-6-polyprenyl-1,4-benzoquinol methylase
MHAKDEAPRATETRMSLREAFETPERKRRYNARLFDTIAPRYDLITRLLSYGRDQAWKQRLMTLSAIAPGEAVLDLACGTGDLAIAAAERGARVTGLDLVPRMIGLAARRPDASRVGFLVGDMTTLPFGEAAFDVVTTGYGLRNVPRLDRALDEIARVLKPRGRFLSLDFNRPDNAALRFVYLSYLTVAGSIVGVTLHGDPDTYRYIPASLARYPGANAVVRLLRDRGFEDARWVPALGGLMALHVAQKSSGAAAGRSKPGASFAAGPV